MKYLFQVHIGPVQGFIASARRTRDLWFGSALLSRLAMEAALTIKNVSGINSLIFPSPSLIKQVAETNGKETSNHSFPNKLLALIDVENALEVTLLGDTVRKAIDDTLERIKNVTYKKINKRLFDRNMTDKQIKSLIEYRWVALPYKEGEYDSTRKHLELLMAARKNTYDFTQVEWGKPVAKSSLDGQLECVIPDRYYPRRSEPLEKRFQKQADLYQSFRAGPSERLSGVDLLKRLGDFDERPSESGFPSTSHIATIPYLERLLQLDGDARSQVKEKWNRYIGELEALKKDVPDFHEQVVEYVRGYHPEKKDIYPHPVLGRYDGAMLFHEHFLDIVTDKKILSKSGEGLQNFFKAVKEQLGERLLPQPYYAILLADGDGMGKVIDHQAKEGSEKHQQLSQRIDEFAESARKIVSNHLGATIYAGGDDVLALVPIHRVLACAEKLSAKFKELLKAFLDESGSTPTLSVGIAIVHHLELLSEALNVARRAEKKAKGYKKKKDGKWLKKNALAIMVSKRSGETYDIAGQWRDLDSFLGQLVLFYRDEVIPKGTAYELRESALRLRAERLCLNPEEDAHKIEHELETDSQKKIHPRDVLLAEAGRILSRKLLVSQGKSSNREKAERALGLLERRLGILKDLAKGKWDEDAAVEVTSTLEEFVHELVIAELLADAERLAGIEKKEDQK
jgi:CRISPR-associated protein Cmr2